MRPLRTAATRLRNAWEIVRESYWFVPSLLLSLAPGLAAATIAVDRAREGGGGAGWLYGGGAEGARSLLTTVASSMITIAGVVFSIAIVALTLASNQFGPRLLRNYVRDRGNQITLGTFVATFLYCLLVARTVRMPEEGGGFVPHLSVTVALGLAVVSLGVLVYFIHHTAASIQAPNVVANVGRELDAAVDVLYPWDVGDPAEPPAPLPPAPSPGARDGAAVVRARQSGYVRLVDGDALVAVARARGVVVRLLRRPGEFLVAGDDLAGAWPAERTDDDFARAVNDAVVVGSQRTGTQDVRFAAEQLVEVAVRALSPGVNDPFTAMACIDRLGVSLGRLAGRRAPSPLRADADGVVRVIAEPASFAEVVDTAFTMLRWHARASPTVALRLLDAIARIAGRVRDPADVETLRRHAVLIQHGETGRVEEGAERVVIRAGYERAVAVLDDRLRALSGGGPAVPAAPGACAGPGA